MFDCGIFSPLTHDEVYARGRIKINPRDGSIMEVVVANRPLFKAVAAEARASAQTRAKPEVSAALELAEVEYASAASYDRWLADKQATAIRSARRAKRRVYDLAACNDFSVFVTLTLDKERIDRYDYKASVRKLNQWLDNRVRRKDLMYVGVPELHKDAAIHYHLLVNDVLPMTDSGHKDNMGRAIYNLDDWRLGFSTAQYLDGDYTAVCHYISKYVTKQVFDGDIETGRATIGGRFYYHGGALQEPIYKTFTPPQVLPEDGTKAVEIPEAGDLVLTYCVPELLPRLIGGDFTH